MRLTPCQIEVLENIQQLMNKRKTTKGASIRDDAVATEASVRSGIRAVFVKTNLSAQN
jgi:hypothetical protein